VEFLKLSFVPTLLLVCVPLAAHGQPPVSVQTVPDIAETHLEKARELFQNGKYGAANSEAKRALKLNKELPPAYVLLGMIHRRKGEIEKAVRDAKQALKYDPNDIDAHYLLGVLRFHQRKFAEARNEAVFLISNGGSVPKAYVLLAQAELANNRHKEALAAFEDALRLNSDNAASAAKLTEQIEAVKGLIEAAEMRRDPSCVPPRPLNAPMPVYTEEARALKIQGTVSMVVLVDEQGKVSSVVVFIPLGFGLDEQAAKAARQMRFTPALKGGRPVSFWQRIEVEFGLR
jgi:TonB family protein